MLQLTRRPAAHRYGLLLGVLILGGCTAAVQPVPDGRDAQKDVQGYLTPSQLPQTAVVLPAAPQAGSARYEADRQIFKATRHLQGTPRWVLATSDAEGELPAMLDGFSCAVGVPLNAAKLPQLANLLARAGADAYEANKPAKLSNQRQRPFQIDDAAVCESKERLAKSFDYPSGHANWSWTIGLILAELAPDRATAIEQRARAYADSRVVCGAHNYSAIEAGTTSAALVVAALHASPVFRQDVASAQRELAAYRRSTAAADAQQCAAERALIDATPY
jgi:acid phosphatase (class A)